MYTRTIITLQHARREEDFAGGSRHQIAQRVGRDSCSGGVWMHHELGQSPNQVLQVPARLLVNHPGARGVVVHDNGDGGARALRHKRLRAREPAAQA